MVIIKCMCCDKKLSAEQGINRVECSKCGTIMRYNKLEDIIESNVEPTPQIDLEQP